MGEPEPKLPSPATPVPIQTSTPVPTPATWAAPTASTAALQGDCVPTNEGLYNNPAVYGPWCEAASLVCPQPMCKRVGALLQGRHSRRHSFLGTALIQNGIVVKDAFGRNAELEL